MRTGTPFGRGDMHTFLPVSEPNGFGLSPMSFGYIIGVGADATYKDAAYNSRVAQGVRAPR